MKALFAEAESNQSLRGLYPHVMEGTTPRWTCTTNSTPAASHERAARRRGAGGLPVLGRQRTKVRPALVVQNDRNNRLLLNTIVVQITSITRRAPEPTRIGSTRPNFAQPRWRIERARVLARSRPRLNRARACRQGEISVTFGKYVRY